MATTIPINTEQKKKEKTKLEQFEEIAAETPDLYDALTMEDRSLIK
jgi:hypothetical protein